MKPFFFRVVAIATSLFASALLASPVFAAPFDVGNPEPNETFINQDTTFHSDLMDGTAVIDHCVLSVDGVSHGAMTVMSGPSGKTAFLETSISTAGSRAVRVTCYDAGELNEAFGETSVTVFDDSSAPSVSVFALVPSAPVVGSNVNIKINYDDTEFGSGIDNCSLYVDSAFISLMSLSGGSGSTIGTAERDYTFSAEGNYSVRVDCTDLSGNVGTRTQVVTVSSPADTTAPVVGGVSPTTATQNVSQSFSVTFSDANPVTNCTLYVQQPIGSYNAYTMSRSGTNSGTASLSYTFPSSVPTGGYGMYATCTDGSGNIGTGPTAIVTVSAPAVADTTPPTVSIIDQISTSVGVSFQHTASYSDAGGVASCRLFIDGTDMGAMTLTGTQAARNHTYTIAGAHTAYVRCTDNAGNSAAGPSKTITVSTVTDTLAPTVSSIVPSTAVQNVPQTYTVTFSDNGVVAGCSIHIEFGGTVQTYPMHWDSRGSTGNATYTWTYFSETAPARNYNIYATCTDSFGNIGTGAATAVNLAAASTVTVPYAFRLVKLACPSGPDVNHPCKAVYYVDSTGTRHAFPNEKVYFSWYTNFNNIAEVGASTMGGMPLGRNVNYRPGTRMVKFTTLNNVYAVGRYGELRWVTSESVASALYGSGWNTKIDDIADTFYTDYTFGADITSAGGYTPANEMMTVSQIDANYIR
jgi:hypothetical protein